MSSGVVDKPSGLVDGSYESLGWYAVLERMGNGDAQAAAMAACCRRCLDAGADRRWAIPLAFHLWVHQQHQQVLDLLLQPVIAEVCADQVMYHTLVGMAARQVQGQEALARQAYGRALELDPNRSDVLYNLANLLKEDDPEQADALYVRSLSLNPQAAACWHNYGSNLVTLDRHREGLQALRRSVCLDPAVADVWCNVGLAFYGLDAFHAAERSFRHTIAMDGHHAPGYTNLGNTLINQLQPEAALEALEKGLSLDSSSTNSLWNLGLAYLLLGHYRQGWEYYEARFKNKDFAPVQIPTSGPQLRRLSDAPRPGDPPLVVWSEQGMGDSIQFVRYLPLLAAAGVPFVFLTRPVLHTLFQGWTPHGEQVQLLGSTQPDQDQRPQIALMSLPRLFGTELHTVPASVPYLNAQTPTPPHLKLEPPAGGLSVGLVWASNPDNKAMYRNKSVALELLMPRLLDLIQLDLIELHSLQFGADADQLAPWRGRNGIVEWKDRLSDFSDTAHVLRQLDLVISVDTAVAHLAGALNRPTWLLLPQNADFRWLKDRRDSPWYPSMRLFRQTRHGDWQSVVEQFEQALDELVLLDIKRLAAAKMA